jgi:polyphosphate kinase
LNSLADEKMINALYAASKAGVQVELLVRGICCLRPGIKGLSENITVRSIVDRFLEHCRIWYFENACQPRVFLGSADWLPRNFYRRIELVFPIEDGILRDRIINEILAVPLRDNVKTRFLKPDRSYVQPRPGKGEKPFRSQTEFMKIALGKPFQQSSSNTGRFAKVELAPRPSRMDS